MKLERMSGSQFQSKRSPQLHEREASSRDACWPPPSQDWTKESFLYGWTWSLDQVAGLATLVAAPAPGAMLQLQGLGIETLRGITIP